MNNKFKITKEGYALLQEEYNRLINEERQKNLESLQDAKSQGDLSENADYDAARNQQAQIANRIQYLENLFDNSEIVESDDSSNFGKWVKVQFEGIDFGDESYNVQTFKIVGSSESDPIKKFISNESPLGEKVLNKGVGERAYVKPEDGEEFWVTILSISNEEPKDE